jgi:O-antigen ligase
VAIKSVEDGDGARVMAARAGIRLLANNFMGINQSKQSFQIAIAEACKHEPKIFIAHAHNAWIDTALSIGLPGAILCLLVLLNYMYISIKLMALEKYYEPVSAALFSISFSWLLMGCLNSTLRDQMLEIQAFNMSFLLGLLSIKYATINSIPRN